MKLALVVLFLCWLIVGCATARHIDRPEGARFMFRCDDGRLFAGVVPDGWDEGWMALVGRCIGELQIIGSPEPTKPVKWS